MRILLVGEYSGFHNALKDGLLALGHEVILLGGGDGFKKFDTDISWDIGSGSLVDKINGFIKFNKAVRSLKDFDVVQFINPVFFSTKFNLNSSYMNRLINRSERSFLVCAGDDSVVWKYWDNYRENNEKYSWIEEGRGIEYLDKVAGVNFYEQKNIVDWNYELAHKVNGIIPIMYEYAQPYRNFENMKETIGIPINTDKIKYTENIVQNNRPLIFHGINRIGVKGTRYVQEAFKQLEMKYGNKIECMMRGRMSYKEYIEVLNRTNISIDQTVSYSMGVNALMSMAMGKVTLGGVESKSIKEMNYDKCPAINVQPDSRYIVEQLEDIIFDSRKIAEIGYESRRFIEQNHNYISIANKYISIWNE
ncbi:hypothetical protein [Myroides odoratimimus]|uniref:hypothetical protein n=1 Tax=Myroides odoratimimus TaxID=76832 RepID=UPI0025755AE4|nr:hypothetical protein [Myroides odoratimimus]MDM1328407.1 glycosyltransferase [Myroides odoratimimus]